jgi:ADP-ribose pyrophosphatase YjhB (NUDIX family)
MKYNVVLISIIYNDKKEILLVRRNREPGMGKWSLSGGVGALKEESDPMKAVATEVYGDFGVNYIDYDLLTIQYSDQPEPTLRLYFYGKIEGDPQIKSVKTIQELRWFSAPDALNKELAFEESDKEVIRYFINHKLSGF